MQITQSIATIIVAASAVSAAPAPAPAPAGAIRAWTFRDATRSCDKPNNVCTWNFTVDDHVKPIHCTFVNKRQGNVPASHANNQGPQTCGPYSITNNWAGSFMAFAVNDYKRKITSYPAYNDQELAAHPKGLTKDANTNAW